MTDFMSKQTPPPSLDQILSPIKAPLKRVEQLLVENLETEIPLLTEVGQYILKSGGKRVRPAMLLFASGAVGKVSEDACKAAGIIEYLHTATLLHDDVVDNADLRRSKKSARTIWGNEASVLVGDYLFGAAFKYLGSLQNLELLRILSDTSTLMARGEIKQLAQNYADTSEEDYLEIIYYKTASLMGSSMQIGAILGGGTEKEQFAFLQCGNDIGMAFQLVDDALDYDISNTSLGKERGTDLKERKITLPLSHLITNSKQKDRLKILDILNADRITDQHVAKIYDLIEKYESFQYTLAQAQKYVDSAKNALKIVANNKFKAGIEQLSDFIVVRRK